MINGFINLCQKLGSPWSIYIQKQVFLEVSQNSKENTCARGSFLIKLQVWACNFIKKETLSQVFSNEFWEISKNTFSYRMPLGDCFRTLLYFWGPFNYKIYDIMSITIDSMEHFWSYFLYHKYVDNLLTLSWPRSLPYRNQSIDLLCSFFGIKSSSFKNRQISKYGFGFEQFPCFKK